MAICYNCDEQFYGYECPCCGWIVKYKCWKCKSTIIPEECNNCSQCGWYECNNCEQCGCNDDRPLSKEEERRGYD